VGLPEGGEGEDVERGLGEQVGGVGEPADELVDDAGVVGPGGVGVGLLEDGAHERRVDAVGELENPGQQLAHDVGEAALPGRAGQAGRDGALEAAVSSETTSCTPDRPRATSPRRNAVQPAPSSVVITSIPSVSRCPALIPTASTTATLTKRPRSRTLIVSASVHTYVQGPASSGRLRHASTRS
jgi:hypothetical protein